MRLSSVPLLFAVMLATFQPGSAVQAQGHDAGLFQRALMIGSNVRNASGPGQYSYQADYSVPTRFETIRLLLVNTALTPQRLEGIVAASSQSMKDMTSPDGGTWSVVTIAGSRTPVLAAATSPSLPSYTLSDEIRLRSLPRSDSKAGSLVFTRVVTAHDAYSVAYLAGPAPNGSVVPGRFLPVPHGETAEWGFARGDFVNSDRTAMRLSNTTRDMALFYVAGLVYSSHTPGLTLMAVGDSLTQGYATASDYAGFGRIAAAMLTASGQPTSYVDASWAGQTTGEFLARAYALLDLGIRPDYLTIPIDSPNDYDEKSGQLSGRPGAQTVMMQHISAFSLAEYARSLGVVPIMIPPLPLGTKGQWDAPERFDPANYIPKSAGTENIWFNAPALICSCKPSMSTIPEIPVVDLAHDQAHYSAALQYRLGTALADLIMHHPGGGTSRPSGSP
ncbi:SGNH/GDSL hydrolase family protein [Asaia bogorensis]|uniref:SGNH/GDSL hydrolase family protein n=1 Tax=Asaia bogorensis TaxID=91915 RepID=UPI000EFA9015|nr:SGNH/GDSL hydrolase family protein [Asaia bogorensis]